MIRTTGLRLKYKPLETISEKDHIYIVRWDCTDLKDTDLVVWSEEYFYHKPSEDELRTLFSKYYNELTDNIILSGFVWNDMPVWLSMENQFNYKAAFDLAIQTNGESLPITFKFGTDLEPVYYEFTTLDDLTDFYTKAVAFKDEALSEGWRLKDAIDYSLYKLEDAK